MLKTRYDTHHAYAILPINAFLYTEMKCMHAEKKNKKIALQGQLASSVPGGILAANSREIRFDRERPRKDHRWAPARFHPYDARTRTEGANQHQNLVPAPHGVVRESWWH